MMPLKLTGILFGMIAFGTIGSHGAHGQTPDSSLADETHRAFHGPDGKGKDGPMAALDRNLIALYYRYRAHDASDPSASFDEETSMPVRDSLVTVDAIAEDGSSSPLLDSLEALGLQEGEQAERLVSGRLPIASLRAAAGLSNLQSLRPSQARTRDAQGGAVRPPAPTPSLESRDDGTNRREAEASSAEPDSTSEPASRTNQKATSDPEPRSEPVSDSSSDSASTPTSPSPTVPPSAPSRDGEGQNENGGESSSLQNDIDREIDGAKRQSGGGWQVYGFGAGVLILGIGLVLVLRQRLSSSD